MSAGERAVRRSRAALAGLAALFLVPLALSFFLYYGTSWRPAGRAAQGELVEPPRPLPAVALPTDADGSTGGDFLRDNWHLIYVGPGDCGTGCRASLVKSRQVRLALDKDANRVGRAFLYTGDLAARGYLAAEHPDLASARVDGAAGAALLAAFPQDPAPLTAGRLYVIDPLGNLMLSYPPEAPPGALLEDLKRLLRLSHIG